ncbi:MAG: hypothetical protein HC775_16755 [Hyellaceae cyanobacterium CSU_1_1]|nr:hypothetical protein [Pleurocapsa sp. CRU_1_2]NJR47258.1 hypothetical protein [Hyellaceae cyanobacterium CSU_1_1]
MVVRQQSNVPALAWIFTSFGFMVFLVCSGISLTKAKAYQLELAQYKLAVGSALNEVVQVNSTLVETAKSAPLPPAKKQQIVNLTEKSNQAIESIDQTVLEEE